MSRRKQWKIKKKYWDAVHDCVSRIGQLDMDHDHENAELNAKKGEEILWSARAVRLDPEKLDQGLSECLLSDGAVYITNQRLCYLSFGFDKNVSRSNDAIMGWSSDRNTLIVNTSQGKPEVLAIEGAGLEPVCDPVLACAVLSWSNKHS